MRSLLTVSAAGLCALQAAAPLAAQGPMTVEAFASRKQLPGNPVFGGAAFTGYSSIFGLRLSGGLHLGRNTASTAFTPGYTYQCGAMLCAQDQPSDGGSRFFVSGWTADADVLLEPLRSIDVAKSLLLGFSPYAFFGVGGYGLRVPGAADTTLTTLSYGLGAHHALLGWLGVEAEARYRRPLHSDSTLTFGTPRNWEYRIGLTASFGGGHAARSYAVRDARREASREPRPMQSEDESFYYVRKGPYLVESAFSSRLGSRVLRTADELVGTDFRFGGDNPRSGFDAAGFVHYVFERQGMDLPSTAQGISHAGERISTRGSSLRPGDLLFFANDDRYINHVAIYVGRDRIIHSTASGGGVRYDVLGDGGGDRGRWFADHLVMARRIVNTGPWDRYDADRRDTPDRAPRR